MRSRQLFSIPLRALRLKRISAVVLALALLATIAPLGVSSHAMGCSMPCCAGGSCSTGACDVSFETAAKEAKPESHCEHGDKSMHVEVVEVNQPKEIDSSELCGAEHLTAISGSLPMKNVGTQQPRVERVSLSRPCTTDCCAGAGSLSQVRRSREIALAGDANKPRPPTVVLINRDFTQPAFLDALLRTQSPPRAPPPISFSV